MKSSAAFQRYDGNGSAAPGQRQRLLRVSRRLWRACLPLPPLSPSENDDGGEGHKTEEWPVGAQRDPESETVSNGLF